jgi:hypothetical protein
MASTVMILSGCAVVAPETESRYVSADGQIQIRGELVDSSAVRIFVNDSKVIDDNVSLLRGNGEFAGTYDGKQVSADCSTSGGHKQHATICLVAVGRERVRLRL